VPALGGLPLHLVGRVKHRRVLESASLCGVGIYGDGCPSVPCAHDHSPAPTQPHWLTIKPEVVENVARVVGSVVQAAGKIVDVSKKWSY
jgi:hypothetical protein